MVTTLARPGKNQPVEAIPAPRTDRPWHVYRREWSWKLLEPGWAGTLDDGELAYIQGKLKSDDALSYWWGFRPGQKTRSAAAIERIAVDGDPDSRASNVKLARVRKALAAA